MNDVIKQPLYILSAVPVEPSKISNIFELKENSVSGFMENPGVQRSGGWDLQTLDHAKIIKGEYLEVRNGKRKIINLYEDGTLIYRMAADEEMLGWGRNKSEYEKSPRLNPVAVIESTYNFVIFYQTLLLKYFENKPQNVKFMIYIKNAILNNARLYLLPYGIKNTSWIFDAEDERKYAQANDLEKEITFPSQEIEGNYEHIAYELIKLFYLLFGIPSNQIPYTEEKNKVRIIDIHKMLKFNE